jgi:hypothetical protein
VEKIHGHASGLNAAALIGSAYRNLHNLFDKPSRVYRSGLSDTTPIDAEWLKKRTNSSLFATKSHENDENSSK